MVVVFAHYLHSTGQVCASGVCVCVCVWCVCVCVCARARVCVWYMYVCRYTRTVIQYHAHTYTSITFVQ